MQLKKFCFALRANILTAGLFMDAVKKAYLELHIAVFLFGFTAILGDLITLSALVLVWWRVFLTCISLLFIIRVRKLFTNISRKHIYQFIGVGILVAIHWVAFYGSIKLANASIALICMATTSFFTSLVEPLVMRYKVKWYELLLGAMIIPGMWLIVSATDAGMMAGIWVGLLAALLASIFATLNKKLISVTSPLNITFLELGSALIFLSMVLPAYFAGNSEASLLPTPKDWFYLLILTLVCTTLAYVLALRALSHLSAFASNLTFNLEPVYGIGLAWLLLGDQKDFTGEFYIGLAIIMVVVFSYPFVRKRFGKRFRIR